MRMFYLELYHDQSKQKTKFLCKPKCFYIDLYQTLFINNCLGVQQKKSDCLCGVRWGHTVDTVEQALLWHQDGNDLMFSVVFKGLKDCMTYNNRERKIMFIWQCDQECVFLSGVVILVPGGQTVSLGSTVVSSPGKSLFHLRVPFLVITDFLPLSFLARGNFHYRNLSLPMSISEFKTLEPKRQHCGVLEFTELVQRNSYHRSQGKSFQISSGIKYFLHSLALSMMHVTLLPFGGQCTEVGESSPSFLVTSQCIEFTILSLSPQRVVVVQNSLNAKQSSIFNRNLENT